ncbi:hypothetical protein [Halalkalibacter krulwichiae]|uniref:Uncharacterized protein n=1 Tax=Halalkalibacter krulwichiae TaxID=199441 RepID=A0A1X9M971_9BACI|nr:hypothetical protein [Halalkalibacter krulwichiae]ARK29946.1 hypothetical protein BkAM31D_08755 [Halalkalibacter krulwichiae]
MHAQKCFISLLILVLIPISGCTNHEEFTVIDSINAKEVLTLEPDADIFQYDGIIYKTDIDWIETLSLTTDVQIGEIKSKTDTHTNFLDEMSNKLPIGAKIYSVKERKDILIVESNGELIRYLAIVEG